LLGFLLAEIKRNIPSAGYITNLSPKLNRFIVTDYFDKLEELLMRLGNMEKLELIYNTDEK
jgi:hypothetical protein